MPTLESSPARAAEELTLSVRFEANCWLLDSGKRFEPIIYGSGGLAEKAAKSLAARLADCGREVHLSIEDRRHAVVATCTYFPSPGVPPGPDASDERS